MLIAAVFISSKLMFNLQEILWTDLHSLFIFLQASYVKNLLRISKYLPSLRLKILELVIDNLIKIDVSNLLLFWGPLCGNVFIFVYT